MTEPFTVKKWAMHSLMSPEMIEDRERVEGMFEATLTAQAEAKGYVVLPGSFEFEIREPNWLTPEEEEGGYTTRDYMRAFASVKCYDPTEGQA